MRFRKVSVYDNLRQVARLLYHANIPAHKAWRGGETEFVDFIQPWLGVKGFLYHYKNLFVASESHDYYPLALVGGLEPFSATGAAEFNYKIFDDEASKFVVNNYIGDLIGWQKFLARNELQITTFATDPALYDDGVGYDLLMQYISVMSERGYTAFRISCDADDRIALQEFEKLGFRRIGESFNPVDPKNRQARLANFALRI